MFWWQKKQILQLILYVNVSLRKWISISIGIVHFPILGAIWCNKIMGGGPTLRGSRSSAGGKCGAHSGVLSASGADRVFCSWLARSGVAPEEVSVSRLFVFECSQSHGHEVGRCLAG